MAAVGTGLVLSQLPKLIPGLKNGGGATRKKMKIKPVDSASRGKYSIARKKGGKVTRKRRSRVKR